MFLRIRPTEGAAGAPPTATFGELNDGEEGMKKVAWSLAVPILALCWQASAQSLQSSFSFQYRLDISVHATIMQAGLRFQGAQFVPTMGTPFGHMEFLVATTTACNIRMFGRSAFGVVPIFDSGPIPSGLYPARVGGVSRGAWQEFVIASFDCFGNLLARDRISFFTPPPQVVTVEQGEILFGARMST